MSLLAALSFAMSWRVDRLEILCALTGEKLVEIQTNRQSDCAASQIYYILYIYFNQVKEKYRLYKRRRDKCSTDVSLLDNESKAFAYGCALIQNDQRPFEWYSCRGYDIRYVIPIWHIYIYIYIYISGQRPSALSFTAFGQNVHGLWPEYSRHFAFGQNRLSLWLFLYYSYIEKILHIMCYGSRWALVGPISAAFSPGWWRLPCYSCTNLRHTVSCQLRLAWHSPQWRTCKFSVFAHVRFAEVGMDCSLPYATYSYNSANHWLQHSAYWYETKFRVVQNHSGHTAPFMLQFLPAYNTRQS